MCVYELLNHSKLSPLILAGVPHVSLTRRNEVTKVVHQTPSLLRSFALNIFDVGLALAI